MSQALSKKLQSGSGTITCMAVHPSGDHVIVGSEDKRLAWFDLDLSDKPYKALRCGGRGEGREAGRERHTGCASLEFCSCTIG